MPIPSRKELEDIARRLDDLQERRRLALESTNVGYWDWDMETNDLWWSSNMFEIYDADEEHFNGKFSFFYGRLDTETAAYTTRTLKEAIENEKPFFAVFNVIGDNGDLRRMLSVGNIIKDKSDNPERMVGINVLVPDEINIRID